jgi:1,4-dihydroxy-2-naphthoate octaprenyltransferase
VAVRPATLGLSIAPVAVGSACAASAGRFAVGPAVAALGGALLLQIGANLANDLFDHQKGADREDRLGPTRAVAAGLLTPAAVRTGMVAALAGALAIGVYLAWIGGPVVIVIGIASMICAVAYTGGPFPLAYHGLGELFVLLFFGLAAVAGTAFVEAGHVPPAAWWAWLPVGALAAAVLVVNNVRDRETDARAGKRTLAVRLGRRAGLAGHTALVAVAYAVPTLAAAVHGEPWLLLPLSTAPLAVRELRALRAREGRALNASLAGTARLALLHGLALSAGLAVS